MPTYGKEKICKARLSTKHSQKCGKTFVTKAGPKQKFCSDRCRKRHHRVIKALSEKKQANLELKEKKAKEVALSTKGNVQRIINTINGYQSEIEAYKSLKKPSKKKNASWDEEQIFKELVLEYKEKKERRKTELPYWNNMVNNEVDKLIRLLRASYASATTKEKTNVVKLIEEVYQAISIEYSNNGIPKTIQEALKDLVPLGAQKKDFDMMQFINAAKRATKNNNRKL